MAKITAPLHSISAAGTIAGTLTFLRQLGRPTAQFRPLPSGPASTLQRARRNAFTAANSAWFAATPAERARWTARAAARGSTPREDWVQQSLNQRVPAGTWPRLPVP